MSEPLPSPVRPIDFNELVDRHYAALFRFALSLAKNGSDAADLTQQTFYLWAAKGHQLRDLAKVKSWLFTTLYREYLSTYRHSTKFPHVEIDGVAHEMPGVAPSIFNDVDGNTVVAALAQVDEVFRAPFSLFYLEEHSYQEIADVLDVPIGTVMSRLSRGKAQLRQLLLDARADATGKIVPIRAAGKGGA
jgi:RNA polymerase sigma factor (sigma-70 family)